MSKLTSSQVATVLKGTMTEYEKVLIETKLARLRSKLESRKGAAAGQDTSAADNDVARREEDLVEMEKTFSKLQDDYEKHVTSVKHRVAVKVEKATGTIKGWFAKKPVAMQTT